MTANEAIITLNLIRGGGYKHLDYRRVQMACNVAIEALEKQMPKKATEKTTNRGIDISGEYDIDFDLCCPICGAVVGTFEEGVNEYFSEYCDNCGQALDRSDTE